MLSRTTISVPERRMNSGSTYPLPSTRASGIRSLLRQKGQPGVPTWQLFGAWAGLLGCAALWHLSRSRLEHGAASRVGLMLAVLQVAVVLRWFMRGWTAFQLLVLLTAMGLLTGLMQLTMQDRDAYQLDIDDFNEHRVSP